MLFLMTANSNCGFGPANTYKPSNDPCLVANRPNIVAPYIVEMIGEDYFYQKLNK
jgi:hypothetical protein